MSSYTNDAIVIGAGAAGLTAAGGLARLGLRVALIEGDAMGGECLNSGCVPSKALIAAAHAAQTVREAARFGITGGEPKINFNAVHAHVHTAIQMIAPHDSEERFRAWGVEVIRAYARFSSTRTVEIQGRQLSAPRIVIAAGSKPRIPPIAGLKDIPYLTNETLFRLTELPRKLLILGGGPIGIEMAQAFCRLGTEVVVIDQERPLAQDEPDAAAVIIARLKAEGVEFRLRSKALQVSRINDEITLALDTGEQLCGSHLLIAAGRVVKLDQLGLANAGVKADDTGIAVDRRLRTTTRGIYAIGDCRQGPRFTHAAGYEGAQIVAEVGFGVPARVNYAALPRVTYTDPELAQVGLTEAQAREGGGRIDVAQQHFSDNDRAVTGGQIKGFTKIVRRNGRVVGACIVGPAAGELIVPWIMIIGGKTSLRGLSQAVFPYPTYSEISKATAFSYYEPMIFSRYARTWARLLSLSRRWLC